MAIKKYEAGTALRIITEIRNVSNVLADPDSVKVSIIDPADVLKVTQATMTKDSTGVYHYDYQTSASDSVGLYTIKIYSVSGALTSIEKDNAAFQLDKD